MYSSVTMICARIINGCHRKSWNGTARFGPAQDIILSTNILRIRKRKIAISSYCYIGQTCLYGMSEVVTMTGRIPSVIVAGNSISNPIM